MQPDQATFLLNAVYLPSIQRESTTTRTVIAAIPPDQSDFRPDPIAKSSMELSWHIVATEIRFLDAVLNGQFDFTPTPRPDTIQTSADLVHWCAENLDPRLAKLTELTPDQLTAIVDFRGMMKMPAVMYLGLMMHHSVHHRGQLSTYLRPMGAKVPAIYGESYDSAETRKAQQAAG